MLAKGAGRAQMYAHVGGNPQEAPTMAATTRTAPPFRADHVGSLLRPQKLLRARQEHAEGALDDAGLRAVEDEAVLEVIRMQGDVGLRTVTDGEFRRASWHMDFIYQIGGIAKVPGSLVSTFRGPEGDLTFTPD